MVCSDSHLEEWLPIWLFSSMFRVVSYSSNDAAFVVKSHSGFSCSCLSCPPVNCQTFTSSTYGDPEIISGYVHEGTGDFRVKSGSVAILGSFDGFHLGHRQLLSKLSHLRSEDSSGASAIISFSPHPAKFFAPDKELLFPRLHLAKVLRGEIDHIIYFNFDKRLQSLSPREFLTMLQKLGFSRLIIGSDTRIGKDRSASSDEIASIATELGVDCHVCPLKAVDEVKISSSQIRGLVAAGDVDKAKKLLGYPWSYEGIVLPGRQLAATLGFPTANLKWKSGIIKPKAGVYRVTIRHDGEIYDGIANCGYRPTVRAEDPFSLEVHLFRFSGDLYYNKMQIYFHNFIRNEIKFANIGELREQIRLDVAVVNNQPRPGAVKV